MNINLYENIPRHYEHIYFIFKLYEINQDIISTYILISNIIPNHINMKMTDVMIN